MSENAHPVAAYITYLSPPTSPISLSDPDDEGFFSASEVESGYVADSEDNGDDPVYTFLDEASSSSAASSSEDDDAEIEFEEDAEWVELCEQDAEREGGGEEKVEEGENRWHGRMLAWQRTSATVWISDGEVEMEAASTAAVAEDWRFGDGIGGEGRRPLIH